MPPAPFELTSPPVGNTYAEIVADEARGLGYSSDKRELSLAIAK